MRLRPFPPFVALGLFLLLLALPLACTQAPDLEIERAEVARVVESNIGWALTKDLDLSFSTVDQTEDLFFFSPDSAGTTQGFARFVENSEWFMDDDFKAVRNELKELYIGISPRADAAWFHCFLDDINEWQGREASWYNVRWTGTLVKRPGGWKIVQMHFSFPVERFR